MTYGSTHGDSVYVTDDGREKPLDLGTREFFERVDATFYKWNLPLHADGVPFGRFFPYAKYSGARVLEVGCGMGTMAMNWARQGARVVASDLNPVAATQTQRRLQLFDLPVRVLQSDGGALPFRDGAFDYVYSWGVLHHSPNLEASISELLRVLRSGGEYGVMLYNRHSLRQWYLVEYLEGLIHGESRFLSPLGLASRYADGAAEEGNPHTWPVTCREMIDLFSRHAKTVDVLAFGDKELRNTLKLLMPVIWRLVPEVVVRAWAHRFGWSLWITGSKG
jgi:SAM-dependent methyltransferase